MRKKLIALMLAVVVAAAVGGTAAAHEGHGSCAGGAPGVVAALPEVAPIPPGPGFGSDFVKPIANAGLANETVAAIHAVYCEPR